MAAAFIRAELLSPVRPSLRTSICSRSRFISAASPARSVTGWFSVLTQPLPTHRVPRSGSDQSRAREQAVFIRRVFPHSRRALIPLIAPPRALDPIVNHRGIPARPGIPSQLLDSEAHLASPIGILPGAPRQILLIHFLGQVLLIDGQQLRRRHRQKPDNGVV